LSVAERREELLRAAIEQIEARGVAAVRIADVATALGVSNALVLYHFSTKEKLVAAAFTYAAEDDLAHLRKLLGRRTTALRRLRAAVRWYAPTGQAKGWRLWIEGWAVALRDPRCGTSPVTSTGSGRPRSPRSSRRAWPRASSTARTPHHGPAPHRPAGRARRPDDGVPGRGVTRPHPGVGGRGAGPGTGPGARGVDDSGA
jgi:AcrR family transcriptional regulator